MQTHAVPEDQTQPSLPNATVYAAKQVYHQNTITALWIMLALCILIVFALLSWSRSVHAEAMHRIPLVVGITPDGVTHILPPSSLSFRADDMLPTVRYFLLHWAEKFYSRVPSGDTDYEVSRLFMEQRLAGSDARIEAHKQIKDTSTGQTDSTLVIGQNVTFDNPNLMAKIGCPETPGKRCRALIDAQRIRVGRSGQGATDVKQIKIAVEFIRMETVPAEIVSENPLGFVITDIHVSEAVK